MVDVMKLLLCVLSGLATILQMQSSILQEITDAYVARRKLLLKIEILSNKPARKVKKARAKRRFWVKPGRCSGWWNNFFKQQCFA